MTVLLQASLTGGELPPSLYGMVDLAWYKNCLKTCRNFIVQPYGGIKNRPGSRWICEVKDSTKRVRLLPFSYSTAQNYVMEFGHLYVRIVANGVLQTYGTTPPSAWLTATVYGIGDYVRNGGADYYCLVPHTSGTFATDLAASKWYALTASDDGAILEMPTEYTESELRSLKFTQSADVMTVVHPNHPPMQLSRYSSTKWTFQPQVLDSGPFQNINVDRSITVSASANAGLVTLTASNDLFYAKHVGMLIKIEQKDFGVSWLPGVSVTRGDIRRSGNNYYEALTTGTTGQNIPIGQEDHWNDGGIDWSYLHSGFGVARITELVSAKSVYANVLSRLPDGSITAGYGSTILATASIAHASGFIQATVSTTALAVGSYGVCLATISSDDGAPALESSVSYRVLSVGGSTSEVLFETPRSYTRLDGWGDYVTITYSVDSFKPPVAANVSASHKWAFGAFGDPSVGDSTNGYGPGFPSSVTYYQQRLCFGGTPTQPDTIWTSRTGSYSDFSQSMQVLDDDSVVFTLAGNQVNTIKSLLQLDKLLVLTNGSVWASSSGQSDVITPSNIGMKIQGYSGISDLPPLGVGGTVLYVQDKGQVVRDLNYQWANDAYTGQNLTARGSHLVDGHSVVEWTFQQSPLNVVWMVREDGVLLGLTYLREQEVAGWHRHDTEEGEYETVCSISEGDEDSLYVVVNRVVNRDIPAGTTLTVETYDPLA